MFKNAFSDELARELGYQNQYPKWWVIPFLMLVGLAIIGVILGGIWLFYLKDYVPPYTYEIQNTSVTYKVNSYKIDEKNCVHTDTERIVCGDYSIRKVK